MDIQKAFAPLKRLELGLCDLYAWYSDRFSQDPEAALVFKRLSLDEKAHAALLDYQKRLVQTNPKDFGAVEMDLAAVGEMVTRIGTLRTRDCPDVGSAVRIALEFETSAAEFHYKNAIRQANPSLGRLMNCLGRADKNHLGELTDFARARGY